MSGITDLTAASPAVSPDADSPSKGSRGAEPPNTEPPNTEPPNTEPPNTEPPSADSRGANSPGAGCPDTDASDATFPATIQVIDSHTEGEPTRVVIGGWPQPSGATMAERRADLAARYDHLRSAVVREPRGHDAVVGALLTPPVEPGSAAGVIFFNNVGYLGMCGHGLIGVVRTLEHLGRLGAGSGLEHGIGPEVRLETEPETETEPGTGTGPEPAEPSPGLVRIDTPVGTVEAELGDGGAVTIRNVPAYCHALDVAVEVPGVGRVVGDVAYGGNWFFITTLPEPPLELSHLDELLRLTRRILAALREQGITGAGGAEIDHVELTGPPLGAGLDARNFVLCPGGEYDRSPCGTGTSAKLATLHARGLLEPGSEWRQESITGGRFTGWLTTEGSADSTPGGMGTSTVVNSAVSTVAGAAETSAQDSIAASADSSVATSAGDTAADSAADPASGPALIPWIRGRAFVTGEAVLRFDPGDPFRGGFGAL